MSYRVPKNGKAGVAFAGVAIADASPLLASIFIGLVVGQFIGWVGYVGVPVAGYVVTKVYIDWKKGRLPGHLSALLYKNGLGSYSRAFDKKNKVFVGNSSVVNPSSEKLVDAAHQNKQAEKKNGK